MSGTHYMGIPREEIPWYPEIDADLCTGCGSCLEFCANGVFEENGDVVKVVQPYNCVVACDACARACPTDAIRFPDKRELVLKLRALRAERKRSEKGATLGA